MRNLRLLSFTPRRRSLGMVVGVATVLALVGVVAGAHVERPARLATVPAPASHATTGSAPQQAPEDYFPGRYRLDAGPPEEHVQAF